ncbi:hypothetical protein VMCG_09448 [Cytospora schulzeri]|uniref:Uncharacterized protein n=1 Tax=Cytospora schulzeri TaxID=448051 RepID=A0A423VKW6_9PEZI|nr:hypothetical protein VMCG_09448 [Valsa malicola]
MEGHSGLKRSSARKKGGQHKKHHKDNQKGRSQDDISQQQQPADAEPDDEVNPTFQGSLDYHKYLHGSSNVKSNPKLTQSPTATSSFSAPPITPKNKFSGDIALNDSSVPSTVFKVRSSKNREKETVLPTPSKTATQYLSEKDSVETIKPIPTLRERRSQTQIEQGNRPEALRKLSHSDLSVLTEIPATLTSSTITASSSPSVAPLTPGTLRSTRTLESIPSGPLSTISYKEIDPAKLQPFIGPLTKQQPPPNRPLPQIPYPSPIKRRAQRDKSTTNMADNYKSSNREIAEKGAKQSMEETAEPHVGEKKGKGLRKKISKFFSGDQSSISADTGIATSYRPLSIDTSRDSKSFSDIFDDVYNAAGGPPIPGRSSYNSGRDSQRISGRASRQSGGGAISIASGEFLPRPSSQLDGPGPPSRAAATSVETSSPIEQPPLTEHPALRGDLALQAQWSVIDTKSVSPPGPGSKLSTQDVPALSVTRQRPAVIDTGVRKSSRSVTSVFEATTRPRSVKDESRTTLTAQGVDVEDVDPMPAFDRTVDLTLHRKSRKEGDCVVASIPRPSDKFTHVRKLFTEQYANGRPSNRYNRKKRFRYFDLPDKIRFEIVRHIIADSHTEKPILLNGKRQAQPAWPDDAFVTLWSVIGPLQTYLWASPHLRADIMVTLLLMHSFHVIYSPFVKEKSSPLATQWLMRYLHMMQDVRLELDMTKLGFGYSWESTMLSNQLPAIGDLVWKFTELMLTRDKEANALGRLTVHCRRYFGYRQGQNPLEGSEDAYRYPLPGSDRNDPRALNLCDDGSAYNSNQPWNYNRPAPSLPPSAKNPHSGHRRHHADRLNRVPYVNEHQLSVADSLRKLVGRVETIRMVGFSEQWTYLTHEALWPKEERDAIPSDIKHIHIDRYTPSRHDYVAPGHAIYLDYGIRNGIHRYPPLPDSEPMVCVDYDIKNDLYMEIGSGKVLTVTENGAEFVARAQGPNIPVLARAPSPKPCGPPVARGSPALVVRASRIPTPKDRRNLSPTMEAMRKGTPTKAAQLLGLPGTSITNTQMSLYAGEADDDVDFDTPTKSRTVSNTSAKTGEMYAQPEEDRMGELVPQNSRSGSMTGNGVPKSGRLSSKKSFLLLGGSRTKSS